MHRSLLLSTLFTASALGAAILERQAGCNQDGCAQAVASNAAGRADCSAYVASTITVTPPQTTVTAYTDVDYYYTTTYVSVFALAPAAAVPSAAIPSAYQVYSRAELQTTHPKAVERQAPATGPTPTIPSYASQCSGASAYSSACSCVGVSSAPVATVTADPPATTTTQTFTYSHAYRALQTHAACAPSSNYNYFNGTLRMNYVFPIGGPNNRVIPNMTPEQCCTECFTTSGAGCMQYSFSHADSSCTLMLNNGGCPVRQANGLTEVIRYPRADLGPVGVGPCDEVVDYFIVG